MPLITRQGKGSKLTIQEMDGNLLWMNNLTEVAYQQLRNLSQNQLLVPGQHYLITDFRTCYDQPDYDQYRNPIAVSNSSWVPTAIDPIVVLAVSETNLAPDAYQPSYPNDSIKYDVTYSTTESGNTAFGRITERIDEFGNRTDYDHHTITFKRYRLRTYNRLNPLAGTVDLKNDGTVLGVDTQFTSLTPGQVIAIRDSSETFYIILTITDDTTMTVTGDIITPTGAGFQFFDTNSYSYDSYYPNNVDGQLDFILYNTFEASAEYGGDGCINTYIGDHATYYVKEGIGDFLLANNVLKDGRYENNTIGDSSYNNTFNDDCTANRIGYAFRNNITDDDFDDNVIGTFFQNNIITANFIDNNIGNNFENNNILNSDFNRNTIRNSFNNNWLDGDWGFDFYENQIGDFFNNNVIYYDFYNNFILNDYNNNQTDFFYGNIIGNNFKGNLTEGYFFNNHIGNDFVSNITDTEFRDNVIGNNFLDNNTGINFGYNVIGSNFQNTTVGNDFGYGGSEPRGNKIGNDFQSNIIGEYFYDNIICDNFQNNTIVDDFQFNQILYPVVFKDFTSSTYVYGNYNCIIIRGSDGNDYIQYFDGTGTQSVSNITA
jgi:hypothetical protein